MKSTNRYEACSPLIKLIGGQKFPEIVTKQLYGVEVKTTNQNHWRTTGNSVMEGTRIENIDRIFLLFGKLNSPIEFKCRPYEECLSEVVVTHSPRYLIDMDLQEGLTIFDKIEHPYDQLRVSENPLKPIIEYYKSNLKKGQEVWWLNQDTSTSIILQFWNSLSRKKKDEYVAKGLAFFPEVFSKDFNQFTKWLYEQESIICPNVRDQFTAQGQGILTWKNYEIQKVPRVILNAVKHIELIGDILRTVPIDILSRYWQMAEIRNPISSWLAIVEQRISHPEKPLIMEYFHANLNSI